MRWLTVAGILDSVSVFDLRPNPPPEELPLTGAAGLPALLALLSLVAVTVILIARELRRRQVPASLSPDDRARRSLDELAANLPATPEGVERFCRLLCDVIRLYVEQRFALPATQQTTVEFLQAIQNSSEFSASHRTLLVDLLSHCDRAKFAPARPPADDCRGLLQTARRFVEETGNPPPGEPGLVGPNRIGETGQVP